MNQITSRSRFCILWLSRYLLKKGVNFVGKLSEGFFEKLLKVTLLECRTQCFVHFSKIFKNGQHVCTRIHSLPLFNLTVKGLLCGAILLAIWAWEVILPVILQNLKQLVLYALNMFTHFSAHLVKSFVKFGQLVLVLNLESKLRFEKGKLVKHKGNTVGSEG